MKTFLSLFVATALGAMSGYGQCSFRTQAVASGDTLRGTMGDIYKTALAYNPTTNYYYSNNAGGTTPCQVFDLNGNVVFTAVPADWRGMWYNPNTGNIEGNTWGNGFVVDSLQSDGNFGGNVVGLGSIITPAQQSPGVYDPTLNKIYFYKSGFRYGVDRNNFTVMDTLAFTGLASIGNITSMALVFTGCAGNEIGIFEAANRKLHMFDNSSGVFQRSIDFPIDSPIPSLDMGHVAFTNDLLWLYDQNSGYWIGYEILGTATSVAEEMAESMIQIYPNPASEQLHIKSQIPGHFEIISISGQVLEHFYLSNEIELDLADYAPGIYFVRSQNGQATKFVRQ